MRETTNGKPTKRLQSTSKSMEDSGTLTNQANESLRDALSAARRIDAMINRVMDALASEIIAQESQTMSLLPFETRMFAAWLNAQANRAHRNARTVPTQARFWDGQEAAYKNALARWSRLQREGR